MKMLTKKQKALLRSAKIELKNSKIKLRVRRQTGLIRIPDYCKEKIRNIAEMCEITMSKALEEVINEVL